MKRKNLKKVEVFLLVFAMLAALLVPGTGNVANAAYAYPFGISSAADNQSTAETHLKAEWQDWKNTYITSSGAGGFKRVQRDAGTDFDTVSEGLGYGLLLSVYFDEKQLFNDLYGYVKKYTNGSGVMSWHIDKNGNITTSDGGSGGATDADEDIAVALVFAHKKWGAGGTYNYENEARTWINNIMRTEVEAGTYVLKPGDRWGGSNVTNPSYFAPAWFRIFAEFTGNQDWIKVANKCYEIINNVKKYNNNTGLVPDWCKADGTPASGQGYDVKYDAIRYHWRTAIDYSWFGTAEAKANCDAGTSFFNKIGISQVKDGYTLQGNTIGQWHTATFASCAAAGSMTNNDKALVTSFYNDCVKTKDSGNYTYFGNTLRMMVLLYMTGNFPNLYAPPVQTTPPPTNTPTSTPTPTNTPTPNFQFTLSGYVDPDFTYDSSVMEEVKSGFKVEIYGINGTLLTSTTTDSIGYFQFGGIGQGSVIPSIKIKKDGYLYREIKNFGVASNVQLSTYSNPIKMWAGDMSIFGAQDDAINMADIMEVAKGFNGVPGDSRYKDSYDFDKDYAINMTDIMIIAKHFNATPDMYPVIR